MPVIVLLVFCALTRVHHHHSTPHPRAVSGAIQSSPSDQTPPAQ
jgi:hypothetical protein